MAITQYGPGDSETWGPCTGHPADPRTPELDDLDDEPAPDEWPFPTFRGRRGSGAGCLAGPTFPSFPTHLFEDNACFP
jgi:hypothetical protein